MRVGLWSTNCILPCSVHLQPRRETEFSVAFAFTDTVQSLCSWNPKIIDAIRQDSDSVDTG